MKAFIKFSINSAVVLALLMISVAPSATAFSSPPAFLGKHRSQVQAQPVHRSHSLQLFIHNKGFLGDEDDGGSSWDELRTRMDQQMNQYYDLLQNEHDDEVKPEHVFIVIFNPNNEAEQGVHTIEFPKGSGQNILLAFESDDECIEFAEMLKNMQFYNPIPQMANLSELESFCGGIGLSVKVVPRGKGLRPPADNVEELGMNPNLQQDKERIKRTFMVSDDEKDDASGDVSSAWE